MDHRLQRRWAAAVGVLLVGCRPVGSGAQPPVASKPEVVVDAGLSPVAVSPVDDDVEAPRRDEDDAATVAVTAPITVDPHEVSLEAAGADEDVLKVTVAWGTTTAVLESHGTFEYCDYVETSIDPVEGAEGTYMIQLLCTIGEDYQSRDSLTALLRVRETGSAEVLWEGQGTSSNEMGCVSYDVYFFRHEPDGSVAVLREQGRYDGGSESVCKEREVPDIVVTTIAAG